MEIYEGSRLRKCHFIMFKLPKRQKLYKNVHHFSKHAKIFTLDFESLNLYKKKLEIFIKLLNQALQLKKIGRCTTIGFFAEKRCKYQLVLCTLISYANQLSIWWITAALHRGCWQQYQLYESKRLCFCFCILHCKYGAMHFMLYFPKPYKQC